MQYWLLLSLSSGCLQSALAADAVAVPEGETPSFAELTASPGATAMLGKRAGALGMAVPQVTTLVAAARGMEGLDPEPAHRGQLEAELFKRLAPSVVLVVTTDGNGTWTGIGSGSILSPDGQILTNLHVVHGHEWVLVFLRPPPGEEFGKAFVGVVSKRDELTDLALLEMMGAPADLKAMTLGDLAKVEVGEDVHAIGHPVGETWTYTKGLVSQVRPQYEWTIGQTTHRATIIQTQTPISPGNSGGPLLDDSGHLVGINTFVNTEAQGINYAVGVDEIQLFLSRKSSRTEPKRSNSGWRAKDRVKTKDSNGDGYPDIWISDEDGDGMPEFVSYDDDFDGDIDGALVDANENGEAEALALDSDGDGKLDCYKMDIDEDGTWDEFAVDRDFDGTPEYVKLL